jgi:hypothetical protein
MKFNTSLAIKDMLNIRGHPSIRGEYSQRQYQSNAGIIGVLEEDK